MAEGTSFAAAEERGNGRTGDANGKSQGFGH